MMPPQWLKLSPCLRLVQRAQRRIELTLVVNFLPSFAGWPVTVTRME